MVQTTISTGHQLTSSEIENIVADFHRDGCCVVQNILTADECAALRDRADELFPKTRSDHRFEKLVLREVATLDGMFRNLLVREPILRVARAILGRDCRYLGSNVIRNGRDEAIDLWHIDLGNVVEFPLPPEVARHDPRIRMPVQWMTFQVALTDIDAADHGATEFVPGSHYSGRGVPTQDAPHFEGNGPVAVLCKAGDMYLTNHQNWHRGAPNRTDRTRYLLQLQYAMSWATWRFNSSAIDDALEGLRAEGSLETANPELLELLRKKPA